MKRWVLALMLSFTLGAQNVTLQVENADVRTVLRAIARSGGVNIVASPQVKGKVTLELIDVPWRTALHTVLQVTGLTMLEERDVITVMTTKEFDQYVGVSGLTTRMYPIRYSDAGALAVTLKNFLTNRGKIDVDKFSNTLIVTDAPPVLDKITEILDSLDQPVRQVLIRARIVEMDYNIARQLGIKWRMGNFDRGGSQDPVYGADLDKTMADQGGTFMFGKILSNMDIYAYLQMLEDQQKAKTLSEPTLVVSDNEEAEIKSGKKIPIVTQDQAGNRIVQFYDIVLRLKVKAHISPDGGIVMDLNPELSDLSGQVGAGGYPIIITNEAKTKLRVLSGETVVVGGVIKENRTRSNSGIPFLSKIPVLGWLFGYQSWKTVKNEILIFVTPEVIEGTAATVPVPKTETLQGE